MASTVSDTASPPIVASFDACCAIPLVMPAFSLFCEIDADISSIEADVSSTLAACTEAPLAIVCAVEFTSVEAEDKASEDDLTS